MSAGLSCNYPVRNNYRRFEHPSIFVFNSFQRHHSSTKNQRNTSLVMSSNSRPNSSRPNYQFKLVLLGESAVGKSSLVLRFVQNDFQEYRESTIGAAFLTQTVKVNDQTTIKFEIWDTAGQERYKSLAPMYYRNANCAVVVYDITSSASLEKAKTWIRELQKQADAQIVIALAGNKADLEERRQVPTEEAQRFAEEENLLFFETSAKNSTNVSDIFTAIAKKLPLESAASRGPRGVAGSRTGAGGVSLNQGEAQEGPCAC
ncbi:hypothetical protein PCANC_19302 [Puccinia coronata f. sp. avenae]|uniref:GTP-binding protein ypt5 n=2 Tax=Puccinia coronata f. sp. avenae TaxID=200324 RepID=A0A2N5ULV0_9BASI|nr:hypothetical protein PCANC_19302 [Puccinia coronata f. sp. avenae]